MQMRDKDKPMLARLLFYLSIMASIMAGIGATGNDIYLASTQWLLVSGVLALWAVFLLVEASYRLQPSKN